MTRILIAEDERVVAWNIEEVLKLIGHEVVATVATAEEAIQGAESYHPDLVIMDIRLGGQLDGIAAARAIYEQHHIPSIYLTAHADNATLEQAMATAPFGYILKPFRRNDLLLAIKVAMRRHNQEQLMRTSRDILSSALNRFEQGAIASDAKGHVIFMNAAAERLTRWNAFDARGQKLEEIIHRVQPSSVPPELSHLVSAPSVCTNASHASVEASMTSSTATREQPSATDVDHSDVDHTVEFLVATSEGLKQLVQYPVQMPNDQPDGQPHQGDKTVGMITLIQSPGSNPLDSGSEPAPEESSAEAAIALDALASDANRVETMPQTLSFSLESQRQIEMQTAELARLLSYKELLGQITQKLRDNYDKHHIVQFAVQEVVKLLGADFGNAVFYNIAEQHPTPIIVGAAGDRPEFMNFVLDGDLQTVVHNQLTQHQRVDACFWVTATDPDQTAAEWFDIILCPMVDDQGAVLGDILVARSPHKPFDSTCRSMLQQIADQCAIAIRQSYLYQTETTQGQESEQFSQLKDNFLGTISHELRTPIASIRMATQMLELLLQPLGLMDADDERASKYVQILKHECKREAHLVDNLLDITRLNTKPARGAAYPIDVKSLVEETLQDYTTRFQQNQQLFHLEYPSQLPTLITVPSYFKRILSELMENACTYTPPGEQIWVVVKTEAERLRLTVGNSGVSMPAAELSRLFTLFYQSPNQHPWRYGGTGLGLALAKRQTEQLGGSLSVESTYDDEGRPWIRFILSFPLSADTGEC